MNIGLIDGDYQENTYAIFNLDLMQLATYHKKQHDFITFIKDVSHVDKFTKVYYVRDYPIETYPDFIQQSNVEYFGKTFRNNTYLPLAPEIRLTMPDTSIYNYDISKWKKHMQSSYNFNIKSNHVRLEDFQFAKEQRTPFYGLKNTSMNLAVHDYDILNVPNYNLLIEELYNPKKQLILKYPVLISQETDLLNLLPFHYHIFDTMLIFTPIPTLDFLDNVCSLAPSTTMGYVLKFKAINLATPLEDYRTIFLQHMRNIRLAHQHQQNYRIIYTIDDPDWSLVFYALKTWGIDPHFNTFTASSFNNLKHDDYEKFRRFCKEHDLDIT